MVDIPVDRDFPRRGLSDWSDLENHTTCLPTKLAVNIHDVSLSALKEKNTWDARAAGQAYGNVRTVYAMGKHDLTIRYASPSRIWEEGSIFAYI